MNKIFRVRLLIISLLCFSVTILNAAVELPDDSVYHIGSDWLNQNNETVNIVSLKGKVQVVAFVYSYCEHSCPIILSRLKHIESEIPATQKEGINFYLISLDPKRDLPKVLNRYMQEKKLDQKYWHMLSGDPDDVLELAALLSVKYKAMNNEANDIAHSNMITILDKQGRIHYQMKGLDGSMEKVITETLNAAAND